MEPAGKPLEILGLCPSIPLAIKARALALAATLSFLQFFNNNKGNGFAYRAAFRYLNSIAFFNVYAWGVMGGYVAVSPFVTFEFWHII
jgi:hypothetical protein